MAEERSKVVLDVPRSVKAAWVKQAQSEGKKLTEWVQRACDEKIKGETKNER